MGHGQLWQMLPGISPVLSSGTLMIPKGPPAPVFTMADNLIPVLKSAAYRPEHDLVIAPGKEPPRPLLHRREAEDL